MKFAVHWAPSVYIIVPGWIAAVAAGAQDGAASAVPVDAVSPATVRSAEAAVARRVRDRRMERNLSGHRAAAFDCPTTHDPAGYVREVTRTTRTRASPSVRRLRRVD